MRRFFLYTAAVAALALVPTSAYALRIALPAPASTKQKVMQAEAVVVGKVSSIDKETVDLEQSPGGPKVAHTVANVKIETALFGAKNVTHIKIAFVKPGEQPQPDGGPIRGGPIGRPFPGRGFEAYIPAEDQEGLFFLSKHPTAAGYFVVQPGNNPLLSTDAKYKDELATAKAMTAAFADPVKALKADKDEDRLTAALALAQKYRCYPQNNQSGVIEETAIPAEETKLLLKVLTDTDWTKSTDAPRLADALGLMPGNYGLPIALPGDGEDALATRQKAFKAWAEKYGSKFEVKKISAKPLPVDKQPKTGTGTVPPGGGKVVPLPAPLPGGGGIGIGGGATIQPVPPVIK